GIIINGVFFKKNFVDSPHLSRANSAKFDILEALSRYLADNYETIRLRLAPSIIDMRPFLWHNYHSDNPNDKYRISIRYTSYLDISSINEQTDLSQNKCFAALSESRRQEVRYAIKDNVQVSEKSDVEVFLKMYYEMSKVYEPDGTSFVMQLRN